KPITDVGSGKPHDPEKKRLSEIIERLNQIFGTEVNDADQLRLVDAVADRAERDEAVMAQVSEHSPEQVMHGLFPKRNTDSLLDAMNDQEKLVMQLLEDED